MTQEITVACTSLNQTPLDFKGNRDNIVSAIKSAKEQGVSLLLLPEMCLSGYNCEDVFLGRELSEKALSILLEIVPHTKGIAVSLGTPVFCEGEEKAFNTACMIVDGEIQGFVVKQVLPVHSIHYESRWFEAGLPGDIRELELEGKKYPLGDLLFSFLGIKLGFEICRDAWVDKRPLKRLARNGVSIVLNPSASHFAFNRHQGRKELCSNSANTYDAHYLYANLLGNESGSVIYDGCTFIASPGKEVISGPRFSFKDRTEVVGRISVKERTEEICHPNVVEIAFNLSSSSSHEEKYHNAVLSWEKSKNLKEEEFVRAVALGLFDYLRKSKLEGFVVSLSGGADSSTVACLVYYILELAVQELGLEDFKSRLSHIKRVQCLETKEQILNELLFCVYQSTKNSSDTTRNAAEEVANGFGANFSAIDVDSLVENYTLLAEGALGRKLNWQDDAHSLQNIQARVRAPSAWLIANARNSLLLATSNRSEASVGYTTMDGDTAGGLSPIGGVDKAFILKFLSFLEKKGLSGFSTLPFLSHVTSQEPTAELRPHDEAQTDEKELMPYVVLNEIERLVVGEKLFPESVVREIRKPFSGTYSDQELEVWVDKFFMLFRRSQWKRERFAPAFFLDDRGLDPRTWHRFPVLSGDM